jgi:hypothetical protein
MLRNLNSELSLVIEKMESVETVVCKEGYAAVSV